MKNILITLLILMFANLMISADIDYPEMDLRNRSLGSSGLSSIEIPVNPAALSYLNYRELGTYYHNLFGTPLNHLNINLNTRIVDNLGVGFNFFRQAINNNYSDGNLNYSHNIATLSFGYKTKTFSKPFSFGLSLKYLNQSTNYDNIDYGSGWGLSFDAGIMSEVLTNKLYLSLMASDLTNASINYGSRSEKIYNLDVSVGLLYKPIYLFDVYYSMNKVAHIGLDIHPSKYIDFQFGYSQPVLLDHKTPKLDFGIRLKYNIINIQYLYEYSFDLPNFQGIQLYTRFDYRPDPVELEFVNIKTVLPSKYRIYEKDGLAQFNLINNSDQNLDVEITSSIKDNIVLNKKISLKNNETRKNLKLTGILPEQILIAEQDNLYQLKTKIEYIFNNKKYSKTLSENILFYSKNAFMWDNINSIGCYITPNNKLIKSISTHISKEYNTLNYNKNLENIIKAILTFDYLGSFGITYVNDPNNPFNKLSEISGIVDNISYSPELLINKTGDCDDCVVLLSAILESLDIDVSLIDLPGHIMLMFNTGVSDKNSLRVYKDFVIKHNNSLYLPIEATKIGGSFYLSVSDGYKTYKKDIKNAVLFDIKKIRQKYLPADKIADNIKSNVTILDFEKDKYMKDISGLEK